MGALRLFVFVFSVWLGSGAAQAERRVALVIGNSAYKSVPRLTNPANDAALVAGMFKTAGFDVVDTRLDLNASEMRKALRDFGGNAREADVAVVYYAGHGIELDGANYLIPTDASLETDSDVLDETVPLDRALFAVEPAKQLRLVILDACRDNPFAKTMKRTVASRGIGRGLAKVEPTSPNTMIAFAAKAGSTASDGDAKNSPFAAALVERLPTPGLDLRKAFGFVRDDVLKNTGYKQEPYVYGSLGGDDVPLVPGKPAAAAGPQANLQDAARRDYELALQAGDHDAWEAFLKAYPNGYYADLAKVQLKKIAAERVRPEAERLPAGKQIADLAPQSTPAVAEDVTRQVQLELSRVGCHPAPADSIWTESSRRALTLFNKYAGARLDASEASADALAAIKARTDRVCPLVCDHGFKADGDACVRIACRAGYRLNDDNECERAQEKKPAVRRDDARARDAERKSAEQAPAKPQATGQLVCNGAGCRPLKPGCRIVQRGNGPGNIYQVELCD